jgi:hypothetical protein
MLYNDSIAYSQSGVSFIGTVQINVSGISSPIILNNISVYLFGNEDYSNSTTVGLVTLNYVSAGYVIIEATADQAEAISQSSSIILNSTSEISLTNSTTSSATVEASIVIDSPSSEISINY